MPPPAQGRKQKREAPATIRSDDRVLVNMESEDPRLLDMEARRLYEILIHSGAKVLGPIPVPIRVVRDADVREMESRIHRRCIKILRSTEETISVLEKLQVSHHIAISFEVEESNGVPHPRVLA